MSPITFPPEIVEPLASDVHDEWMAGKRAAGCQGVALSRHTGANLMVPYDQLLEEDKEDDRRTVRTVLAALAETGHLPVVEYDEEGRPPYAVQYAIDRTGRLWKRFGENHVWITSDPEIDTLWTWSKIDGEYGPVVPLLAAIPVGVRS